MSAAAAQSAPAVGLPRSYLVWLGGSIVSQAGDAALYFALGWAASAHGGPAAALVLTGINLPKSVLLLVGGAVGDRLGARRVMIAGDSAMLAVAAILAVVSWRWSTPLALLMSTALIIGTVDAQRLHRRLPTSTLAIIDGAAHMCHFEKPQLWSQRIREFVDSAHLDVFGGMSR